MYSFIVYKTTNLVNGKFYIGKHRQLIDVDFDGYLGSGIAITRAIEEYGKDNFIRETIAVFDSEDACYQFEKEYIGNSWQNRDNYNLGPGGDCGPASLKQDWWNANPEKKAERSQDWKSNNPSFSRDARKRISESNRTRIWSNHSRQKISNFQRGRPKPKSKCIHCGRMIANNLINRYHNDNCKEKING